MSEESEPAIRIEDAEDCEPRIGTTLCRCLGEGCWDCDGDGVIYP